MKPYYDNGQSVLYHGDCRSMTEIPDESIQCVVTSPPYWGLRDYGVGGQIGIEETPEAYVETIRDVFREVWRVLRNDGTLWLNLGDSYFGSWANYGGGNRGAGKQRLIKSGSRAQNPVWEGLEGYRPAATYPHPILKPKDLVGIPWRVAFALQEGWDIPTCVKQETDRSWLEEPKPERVPGWYLRQDIIWSKPNPMPESVTDRCTKSHEYLFLLSKNARYYYDQDAIKEPIKDTSAARLIQDIGNQEGSDRVPGKTNGKMKAVKFGGNKQCPDTRLQSGKEWNPKQAGGGSSFKDGHSGALTGLMANKKSVWTITTQGYKEAHFATFPEALVEPCVLAGSRPGDTVLDPFAGSGTTLWVAQRLGRKAIGYELKREYCDLALERIMQRGMAL